MDDSDSDANPKLSPQTNILYNIKHDWYTLM